MRQALTLHPDSRCTTVTRIAVDALRPRPGTLVLRYVVTGRIGDLSLPPVADAARVDGLWRHTCFEAFVRASSGTAYYEFNLAPSTQWAAYRFGGYRADMSAADGMDTPAINVQEGAGDYTLKATLELDRLADLPGDVPWRLGLAAVIEEANGGQSYWALAHPPGKADFHHADGFVHELRTAERP